VTRLEESYEGEGGLQTAFEGLHDLRKEVLTKY
jgi:hypothetical protein